MGPSQLVLRSGRIRRGRLRVGSVRHSSLGAMSVRAEIAAASRVVLERSVRTRHARQRVAEVRLRSVLIRRGLLRAEIVLLRNGLTRRGLRRVAEARLRSIRIRRRLPRAESVRRSSHGVLKARTAVQSRVVLRNVLTRHARVRVETVHLRSGRIRLVPLRAAPRLSRAWSDRFRSVRTSLGQRTRTHVRSRRSPGFRRQRVMAGSVRTRLAVRAVRLAREQGHGRALAASRAGSLVASRSLAGSLAGSVRSAAGRQVVLSRMRARSLRAGSRR